MTNISSLYKYTLLIWTVIILIVYALIVNEKNINLDNVAKHLADSALNHDTALRYWVTAHGGVYVKATKKTPPNENLAHLKHRDIITKDHNLTLMNPAYVLRQKMTDYEGLYGLKGHITSLKVFNKTYNMPDPWEKKVLLEIEKSKNTNFIYEKIEENGEKYLRAFQPLVAEKGCLKCHKEQGYKVGDIRGGVSVKLPLKELLSERNKAILRTSFYFVSIYILGLILIRLFYKKAIAKSEEEEKLKNELINSERYFKEVVNTAKNTIIINNEGKEIENVNQSFFDLTGYSSLKEFKNEHNSICEMFIKKDGFISTITKGEYWLDYISNHKDDIHKVLINKNNVPHTFLIYVNKFQLSDNNAKYVIVLNDITEIVKKEDMLLIQSRHAVMGEMISMIAHQWRQPITTIAMNVNTMLADIEIFNKIDKDEFKKLSYFILDQTKHLSQTIDDFKNFFRPDKPKEEIVVNDIIDETLQIIEKSLEYHNVLVIKDYKSDSKINLFSRELLQVFLNLIKNAKEALLESKIIDATIKISTYEEEDKIIIKICDNGNGIDESIMEKIFDPYFTTKDEKMGTGLGLYMCKTIVHQHLNGKLECFNDNGACFQITLFKGIS